MKKIILSSIVLISFTQAQINIPDTGQTSCYDNQNKITCSKQSNAFYGQDSQYQSNQPTYHDNQNGTITDKVTNLMWTKEVDNKKVSLDEATTNAKYLKTGGYNDWRVPTVKELYSLMDFRGYTGFSGRDSSKSQAPSNAIPFINTDYFDFKYGQSSERYIDAQWLSSTKYVSTTMNNMETLFGVNFADGRIKGYGYKKAGASQSRKKFYVRYVRGTKNYGKNSFVDNGNGTLKDKSTNLIWTKTDSKKAMNWEDALKYAENLTYGGHSDWRLPNAKELQYIVDYSKSPDTTYSPAIDDKFKLTPIKNEAGDKDYAYYWTSTTHSDGPNPTDHAVYISFGRAMGKMRGEVMDVHGAGAQRSDPKNGTSAFRGPQGDAVRGKNYVLCVRGGNVQTKNAVEENDANKYPNTLHVKQNNTQNNNSQNQQENRFVSRLDKNGDGKVSKSEFDGPSHAFDRHDANSDGYLSEEEAPKGPPRK